MTGGQWKGVTRVAAAVLVLASVVQCQGAVMIRLEGCAKGSDDRLGGADYLATYGASGDDGCGAWRFQSVFNHQWSDLPKSFYQGDLSGVQLTRYAESGFQSGSFLTTTRRGRCQLSVLNYPVKIKLDSCTKAPSEPSLGGADYTAFYLPATSSTGCGQWVFKSVYQGKWAPLPNSFYGTGLSGDTLRHYAEGGFQTGSEITTRSRGRCDLVLVGAAAPPAAKPPSASSGSVAVDSEQVAADLEAIKAAKAQLKADQDKLKADEEQASLGNSGSHASGSSNVPTGSGVGSGAAAVTLYAGLYPGYDPCSKLIRNSPDTIFVFNDNLSQFNLKGKNSPSWCTAGGGNACLRPYNEGCPKHIDGTTGVALGIPTGIFSSSQGSDEKGAMAEALQRLQALLATGKYSRVMYNGGDGSDLKTVGSGIFNVAQSVKDDFIDVLLTATGLTRSDIKIRTN